MRPLAALLLAAAAGPAFAADPVTYAGRVAGILDRHCVACHRAGEVGPFPLTTFAEARKRAELIAGITETRAMPPWKPDPGHGEFRDDRRLSDADVAALKAWADAGAPEGDPATRPTPPPFKTGWKLGTPDIVLKMPEAFPVPAEGRDIYHQFVFPLDLDQTVYVRGVECRPGNPRVAHHAVGILDRSGTGRKLDAKHPGPGYPGNAPGFIPAGFTPGYVPGQTPRFLQPGTAIELKKGTDLVLQMHYHPSGKPETDQTEIGLFLTTEKPKKGLLIAMLGSEEIDIPAGESQYRAADKFVLPADLRVTDVWAHMHVIGKSVRVWADLPDGTTRKMLRISDWDFNWQDTYVFKEPFILPKGTVVRAEWTWDNSADNPRNPFRPPQRVRLGEGSTDEMSGLIIGGTANAWPDEIAHWGAVVGHYFEIGAKGWKYKRR